MREAIYIRGPLVALKRPSVALADGLLIGAVLTQECVIGTAAHDPEPTLRGAWGWMRVSARGHHHIAQSPAGRPDYHYSTVGRSSRLISIFKRLCACAASFQSERRTRCTCVGKSDLATGFLSIRLHGCCRKSLTNCSTAGRVRPVHSIHKDLASRRLTQCLADLEWHSARSAW